MTDAEFLARFERRSVRGCYYLRERETGKRTRLYISLQGCMTAIARGLLYTDAEYTMLTTLPAGAAPRKAFRSHR